jgi:hypothetical protein
MKVVQRALGLGSPQLAGRDFDRAEAVLLNPVFHMGVLLV